MPIPVDDLRKGQWLTVSCLRDVEDVNFNDDHWEAGNWWKTPEGKKHVVTEHPWITGAPLKVLAVGLPFVCLYNPNIAGRFSLDTRVFGFCLLDKAYCKAMQRDVPLKPGQVAGPIFDVEPKKPKEPREGLCPHCLHSLHKVNKELNLSGIPGFPSGNSRVWLYECYNCGFNGFRR